MSMQLLPPRAGLYEYTFIEQLVKEVNKHAKKQGYSMTRKRSKRSKKGVLMKTWIRCDRGDDEDPKSYGHRITSSKRVDCPFECIAKLQFNIQDENDLGDWILTIEHDDHNHLSTKPSASIVQRNIAMQNPTMLREIQKEFWKDSKASSVLKGLRMDEDDEDSIFKPRDIWNEFARLRAKTLGVLTPTQALMQNLTNQEAWYVDYKARESDDQLEYLFFTSETSQKMLACISKSTSSRCALSGRNAILIIFCTSITPPPRDRRALTIKSSRNFTFPSVSALLALQFTS